MQKAQTHELNERLATSGLRFTAQRQHVYDVLLQTRDHPTAEEVFIRARQTIPDISIATVYNCLDALVKCNLVRQVNVDRGATRFCPNMEDHYHFCCDDCGHVYDIDPKQVDGLAQISLPKGFKLTRREISLKGLCPECVAEE
ncbi:MAG: transcriptional repressor [Verrucomicrobia bacterium]|nr:transcriptional repressor [Verrucomicrobiota bacterium]